MKAIPLLLVMLTACCSPHATAALKVPQLPSVVAVESMFGEGSGVVIYQEGTRVLVLTSKHNEAETVEGQAVLERHEHPLLDAAVLVVDLDEEFRIPEIRFYPPPMMGELLIACGRPLARYVQPTLGLAGESPGQMSCPSLWGMSGGAVIDAEGRLVGIVDALTFLTRSHDGEEFAFPSFSFYIPISALWPWLEGILR